MPLTLNKLPWYGQLGVFAALGAAAVGAFYYFYAADVYAQIATREQQLAKVRAEINRGLSVARQLPQIRAEVADLEARLESLKTVLPDEKDFADLLRRLQTLATQSNLTVRSFKPLKPTTRQMHMELPISLELDGGYHNLGLFFDRISKFPRIIAIGNLHIAAKDKPTPDSTVVAECTATTYVLLETPPAATPGKPGAPVPPRPGGRPAGGAPGKPSGE